MRLSATHSGCSKTDPKRLPILQHCRVGGKHLLITQLISEDAAPRKWQIMFSFSGKQGRFYLQLVAYLASHISGHVKSIWYLKAAPGHERVSNFFLPGPKKKKTVAISKSVSAAPTYSNLFNTNYNHKFQCYCLYVCPTTLPLLTPNKN